MTAAMLSAACVQMYYNNVFYCLRFAHASQRERPLSSLLLPMYIYIYIFIYLESVAILCVVAYWSYWSWLPLGPFASSGISYCLLECLPTPSCLCKTIHVYRRRTLWLQPSCGGEIWKRMALLGWATVTTIFSYVCVCVFICMQTFS